MLGVILCTVHFSLHSTSCATQPQAFPFLFRSDVHDVASRSSYYANTQHVLHQYRGVWIRCAVLCRSKAEDLKQQLVWWQTPPDGTWPAREQHIERLEYALQVDPSAP